MMTSSMAFYVGNSPVTDESPHKGQWRGASMFPLICAWTNRWANNGDAGDLRHRRAHYDIIVMLYPVAWWKYVLNLT